MLQCKTSLPCTLARVLLAVIAATQGVVVIRSTHAANATWSGATDALWATTGNWNATPVPGSADTATFNTTSSNTTINVGTGLSVGSIVYDTASAAAYTIGSGAAGSQTLTLGSTVTVNAGVTTNQLFNANVLLGTATAGTYTFTNGGSGTLTFSGTVQGGSGGTAGTKTLNVAAAGATNFTNVLGAGGGTALNLANTSTGTVTLSGAVSSSLGTLRASSTGWMVVDGQTVTVASSSAYANSKFELRSGSVAFNGGIPFSSSSDGGLLRVSGGIFTAASVSMQRTGNTTATATSASPSTSGFVVTGGTATISGVLDLAGSNSSVSGLLSGGSLSVGGELRIGNSSSATGRWMVFQVSGGSLTSSDAVNGIVLARNATNANNTSLLLTGGTTTAEKISFGVTTTASNSRGVVTLNGTSAALYLGSGGIVKSATNPYTTTVTLTSGLLGAKADWSSSLDMSLNGSGTSVTIKAGDVADVSRNISLSGVLSGSGGITKTGGGTLTLSNANTYTGGNILSSGSLVLGNASALGSGTASLAVNGGTLNVAGFGVSVGAFSGAGGTVSSSVAGGSLSTTIATSATFAGVLADGTGSLALSKDGSAALVLTGTSTYTGNTTITSGTLEIGGAGQLGGGSYAGTISNGGAIVHSSAANQTFSGTISGAGSLMKSGNGALTLSAANSYAGATTVSAGTLALSDAGALASTGTVSLTGSTAVFDLSGASGARTIGLLSGSAGSSLLLGANGMTVGNATGATFNGQITGSGVVTKVGAGSLTLTGSNTAWTGGAVLTAGTVALGGSANTGIGTGPVTFQGGSLSSVGAGGSDPGGGGYGFANAFVVPAGQVGTLNLPFRGVVSGSLTGSGTFNVNVHGTRDDFTGNWSVFNGQINIGTMTGSGDFRVANYSGYGSAAVNLATGVTMYQTVNPPAGGETVQAIGQLSGSGVLGGNPVAGRFVNWSVGGLNTSSTFAGRITDSSGAARLTKTGTGTLALTGSNSYTGSTTISDGGLTIAGAGMLGSGSYAGAISNAASFIFDSSADQILSGTISGVGSLTRSGAGRLTLSAANTYTGLTTISGGTLALSGSGSLVSTGTVQLTGVTSVFDISAASGNRTLGLISGTAGSSVVLGANTFTLGNATSVTFGGRITGAGGLTKVGSGTFALTGANDFSGPMTVSAGRLQVGDGGTTGSLASSLVSVAQGSVLAFNRSDEYGGAFAGIISGSGNVRVEAGRLSLVAANTFTGTTSVLAGGTLAVNGSLANTALNVAAGATLMGSGTIGGLTTIAGLHSPGNSPGIETFTDLTYTSGASVNWELWGNTSSNSPLAYDQIVVNGWLGFSGATALNLVFTGSAGPSSFSTVDWTNAFWDANQEWQAYSVSGSTTGFANLTLSVSDWLDANGAAFQTTRPNSSFALQQRASGVYVVYAIVPEPAGLVLSAIGGGIVAWRMIRRRMPREGRG